MTDRKTSLDPIFDERTSVLILGTLPGDRSLAAGEYYGHPQNRFWRVVATVTDNPVPENYSDKKALLLGSGIGLWDVLHKATRRGSLDSAIREGVPNDIAALFDAHKHIKAVAFNGRNAEKLHDKHFVRQPGIAYISLPSTSPANAAASLEILCERWVGIVKYL